MAVYWTIGWCYRLAHRKWPKIPYVHKNITVNGTVIDTVTAVEDIWFNDTTCEGNYKNWSHYPDYFTNWGDTIILICLLFTFVMHLINTYCQTLFCGVKIRPA